LNGINAQLPGWALWWHRHKANENFSPLDGCLVINSLGGGGGRRRGRGEGGGKGGGGKGDTQKRSGTQWPTHELQHYNVSWV